MKRDLRDTILQANQNEDHALVGAFETDVNGSIHLLSVTVPKKAQFPPRMYISDVLTKGAMLSVCVELEEVKYYDSVDAFSSQQLIDFVGFLWHKYPQEHQYGGSGYTPYEVARFQWNLFNQFQIMSMYSGYPQQLYNDNMPNYLLLELDNGDVSFTNEITASCN